MSNDDKLAGYALFKQATIGDCNIPAPGMLNFTVQASAVDYRVGEGEMERVECAEGFALDCRLRGRNVEGGGDAEVHRLHRGPEGEVCLNYTVTTSVSTNTQ